MNTNHSITIQIGAKLTDGFMRTVDSATKAVNSLAKGMGSQFQSAYTQASTATNKYVQDVAKVSKGLMAAQIAQKGLGMGSIGSAVVGAAAMATPVVKAPAMTTPTEQKEAPKSEGWGSTVLAKAQQQVSLWQDRIHASSMQVEDAFAQDAISTKEYAAQLDRLTSKLKLTDTMQSGVTKAQSIGQSMKGHASDMGNADRDILVQGTIAAATLGKPINDAMKFESAMADVRKVVDFDTPEQFKAMNQDIINLTRSIPMSATEIATLVASAGQAGIEKDGLLDFAQSAGKMGVAFDITAEQAGDMMAKWRTSFKMGQTEVNELADKVNYLGNTTAASAPLIADVVTRVGPLGDIGGVASGEIAALGASMVGAGVQSEVAATGIKNLILGMAAGEGATKSQAAAFSSLGLDAAEMAKKMQTDAKGAIMEVFKALKNVDKDKQAAILADLFGKESIGAISPLLSNLQALQDNFDKVADKQNYAGSVDKEYAARVETTQNQLDLLKNAVTEVSIYIGNALLPVLGAGAKGLAEAAKIIADFGKAHPDIGSILSIGGALVVIAPLAQQVFRFLFSGVKLVYDAFRLVGVAIRVISAIIAANPIVLLIAGIALAVYLIYQYWEPIKEYMASFWDGVVQKWNGFLAWCDTMWASAMNAWDNFVVWCGEIWNGLVTYLNNVVDEVIAWFSSMWDTPAGALLGFIGGPITGLITAAVWVIDHWSEVSNFVSTMWDAGEQAVADFAVSIQSIVGEICKWAQDKWEALRETLAHPIDAVVNFIKGGDSQAAAAGGKKIGGNAKGGIYGRGAFLTWFAEDSEEAAIPIDGSQRAKSLWVRTGQMMGLLPDSKSAIQTAGTQMGLGTGNIPVPSAGIMENQSAAVQVMNEQYLSMTQPMVPNEAPPINIPELPDIEQIQAFIPDANAGRDVERDIRNFYETSERKAEINATFAPQIVIQGKTDTAQLDGLLQDKLEEFKAMLERIARDNRRLAYD